MDLKLKDKVVLITGGTGGIGGAIVKGFLAEGAKVAFSSTSQTKIDALLPTLDAEPGQVAAFVAAMNRKAADVGAAHTAAVNPVGLDAKGQLTTAEDVFRIARVFLDDPVLAEICGLPTAKITSEQGKTVSLKNTNRMLLESSEYYNEAVAGVKTGTTNRAGNCLVSVFTIDGERYLCVVMNSSYYGKFTDTQRLYDLCADAHERGRALSH